MRELDITINISVSDVFFKSIEYPYQIDYGGLVSNEMHKTRSIITTPKNVLIKNHLKKLNHTNVLMGFALTSEDEYNELCFSLKDIEWKIVKAFYKINKESIRYYSNWNDISKEEYHDIVITTLEKERKLLNLLQRNKIQIIKIK